MTVPSVWKTKRGKPKTLADELGAFEEFGKETIVLYNQIAGLSVPVFINEFWTSGQRQANKLHEISYRACFKPQLPKFFIDRLTEAGDVVYDPFMGRGTTLIEAALLGRVPMGCDINPLSSLLTAPRLRIPNIEDIEARLRSLELDEPIETREDLLAFYHPNVLTKVCNLRQYFIDRRAAQANDSIDDWIQMVATNRLTGHSPGFFSVYTMPPNQAVSVDSQMKINEKRKQTPPERDIIAIILKKSRALMKEINPDQQGLLSNSASRSLLLARSCDDTPEIAHDSVSLVVTSPPFLKIVAYELDNWLRCWFNGINPGDVHLWQIQDPAAWQAKMTDVFRELRRVLKPGGHIAFEVGEISHGKIKLEDLVIPAGHDAGLEVRLVVINDQDFTKTSNCWGVSNQTKGTNTNRIVLLRKAS
ncbi:site-specific DNA-methyltransferase [Verrucomicrobiales bacterium]|nr:site-specific DNA-methyltransferase [Verrucomicrobiales bacterium]MDC0503435.1 site-specific DNA-methyltransferase [Verrucomicrobiales bacterium]MDF1786294.1 DNA methyltransferase [Verrucomicrobiales bacterium]